MTYLVGQANFPIEVLRKQEGKQSFASMRVNDKYDGVFQPIGFNGGVIQNDLTAVCDPLPTATRWLQADITHLVK